MEAHFCKTLIGNMLLPSTFKGTGALSAAEGAAMAGRPTQVHQGLIEVGAKQLAWRQLAVASSDVAVDVQLCYMSYSNCKGQYLNKTLELFYYEMIITF